MFNIFEQPWTLLSAAVVTLLVILMVRRILPDKQHWWQLVLPIFLAGAAFGFHYLVQTDTEKIEKLIKTVTKAVAQENADVVETFISSDYHDSYHRTKDHLMRRCRAVLSSPVIEKNITRIVSIDVQDAKAIALFTVRILFDKQSYIYEGFKSQMLTKVEINLQKRSDGTWLISRSEILTIDMRSANWDDIR